MMRMEHPFSGTRRPLIAILVASVATGVLCTAVNLGILPDRGGPQAMLIGAATTHVLVDSPAESIVKRRPLPQDQNTLVGRGEMLGRLIISPLVLDRVAHAMGVRPDQVSGLARTTTSAPRAFTEPGGERRASEVRRSSRPYRLEVPARQWTPIVDIYAQAPSAAKAEQLADAAVRGAQDEMDAMASRSGVPQAKVAGLRQLGPAHGSLVNHTAPMVIGGLTFMVSSALCAAALLGLLSLSRRRRRSSN